MTLRIVPQNFIDEATLVASPAMVSTLPETNIQLVSRGDVARSTSLADQTISGAWGSDGRYVDSFFVFNHKGYGGTIRLQLFEFPDYTGQVYDSGTVPFVAALGNIDTLISTWDYAPLGIPPDDLLAMEAPYYLFFAATKCASFKITFGSCVYLYWEIGRCFLGKYLEAPYSPKMGMQLGWATNTQHVRSYSASLRTRAGERWREFTANMVYATDADRAAWRDVMARIDARDFVLSVFPGVGGRQERDYVANMKNETHSPFAWSGINFNETTLKFTEV